MSIGSYNSGGNPWQSNNFQYQNRMPNQGINPPNDNDDQPGGFPPPQGGYRNQQDSFSFQNNFTQQGDFPPPPPSDFGNQLGQQGGYGNPGDPQTGSPPPAPNGFDNQAGGAPGTGGRHHHFPGGQQHRQQVDNAFQQVGLDPRQVFSQVREALGGQRPTSPDQMKTTMAQVLQNDGLTTDQITTLQSQLEPPTNTGNNGNQTA